MGQSIILNRLSSLSEAIERSVKFILSASETEPARNSSKNVLKLGKVTTALSMIQVKLKRK